MCYDRTIFSLNDKSLQLINISVAISHQQKVMSVYVQVKQDVVCCFKQILEAAPYNTAIVWLFTTHLANELSKKSDLDRPGTPSEVRTN